MTATIKEKSNQELISYCNRLQKAIESCYAVGKANDAIELEDKLKELESELYERNKQTEQEVSELKKLIQVSSNLKSQTTKQASTIQVQPIVKTEPILETKTKKPPIKRKKMEGAFDTNDARRYRSLVTDLQVQLKSWMLIKEENKPFLKPKHKKLVETKLNLIVDHIKSRCKTDEWKDILLNKTSYSSCYDKKRFNFNLKEVLKEFGLN